MFHRVASLCVVLTLSVAAWLLVRACTEALPLRVVTLETMHTYVYTSEHETFHVPVAMNDATTPFAMEEGIVRAYVESTCQRDRVPVTLVSVHEEGKVTRGDVRMHAFSYELRIGVVIQDGLVAIDEAELVLKSVDGNALRIPIGAFYYRFDLSEPAHLRLYDRHNVHAEPFGMPTSVGVIFRVRNGGDASLTIDDVSLGGSAVRPDMRALRRFEGDADPFLSIDTLLGRRYDALAPARAIAVSPTVAAGETAWFFVPFSYQRPLALHRYPLIISYTVEGETHQLVGDDFTMIRTPMALHESAAHREVFVDD